MNNLLLPDLDSCSQTPPQEVRKHFAECEQLDGVIKNPPVKNNINLILSGLGKDAKNYSGSLVLSYNNIFQQEDTLAKKYNIKQKRVENRNEYFRVLPSPPKFCNSTRSMIAKVDKGEIKEISFGQIPCRSWACPVCSIKKAQSLRLKLTQITKLNNLTYFLTLTLDPKKIPDEFLDNTHAYITKIFNHFKTLLTRDSFDYYDERLNRHFNFDLSKREVFKYIWVMEFQKNGNAHMHILCNQFLPVIVIRKLWVHVGGGHRIDIDNVRSIEKVSNYVFSYLLKGIKSADYMADRGYGFRIGQRRYSVSKSCEKPKFDFVRAFENESVEGKRLLLKQQGLGWISDELDNQDGDILKIVFNKDSPA